VNEHVRPASGRPGRPAPADCEIVAEPVGRYLTDLETYADRLASVAWRVAVELHYEAQNHNAAEFKHLAELLEEVL
jgi:hypothetical protein